MNIGVEATEVPIQVTSTLIPPNSDNGWLTMGGLMENSVRVTVRLGPLMLCCKFVGVLSVFSSTKIADRRGVRMR